MLDVKVNSNEDVKLPFLCNLQKVDICLNMFFCLFFNPEATEGGRVLNWRKEERMMNSGY